MVFLSYVANAIGEEASLEICVDNLLLEEWLEYHDSECHDDTDHQDEEHDRNFGGINIPTVLIVVAGS